MRMRGKGWVVGLGLWALGMAPAVGQKTGAVCARVVVEGEAAAGQSFEKVFTPGLKVRVEAIDSGWIVRVLPVGEPREAHDYAELATPPYQSVTPLAVSTDFSFRGQDAVGWNPRGFRYAASSGVFRRMKQLYGPALAGDGKAAGELAALAAVQPEAELKLLDTRLVPGTNDQAQMAAVVASHFAATPHTVEQARSSPLGKVTWMRFRLSFELRDGARAATGIKEEKFNCEAQPTARAGIASQSPNR